ncbi:MAG: acyl carrier protein [Candidatus Nanopelagicales bacterium]
MNTDRAHHVLLDAVGLVAPDVEPAGLDPSESLRDQAGLDSIDFLELVALLADALRADIPEDDYPQLDTIDSAVAYLAPKLD